MLTPTHPLCPTVKAKLSRQSALTDCACVTMTFTGSLSNFLIMAQIFFGRETPLLVGDILPETSKSSACWDMCVTCELFFLCHAGIWVGHGCPVTVSMHPMGPSVINRRP